MGSPKQPTRVGLGDGLRKIRHRAGMTMGDMARTSGLSLVLVSDIERGIRGTTDEVRIFISSLPIDFKAKAVLEAFAEITIPRQQPPAGTTKEAKT